MALQYRNFVRLRDVRKEIEDGDLLLFRRRGLISIAGRGVHSHAAKVAWWGDELICLEVREWIGGRAVTLESQVRRNPGRTYQIRYEFQPVVGEVIVVRFQVQAI